jgi:integrase
MVPAPAPPPVLAQVDQERLNAFYEKALTDNTKKAYVGDWKRFQAWCESRGHASLPAPPVVVAQYLAYLAHEGCVTKDGRRVPCKTATIDRALVAISVCHKQARCPTPRDAPEVKAALQGIHRELKTAPKQKLAIQKETLLAMVRQIPEGLRGMRDRMILCFGLAFAQRRGNFEILNVEDLEWTAEGVRVTITSSKTDQEGRGAVVGIVPGENPDTCPVRALRQWLDASGIKSGPIFRCLNRGGVTDKALDGQTICQIVQQYAGAAGFEAKAFGAHSLRSGFVTMAFLAGKQEAEIANQTGHKSVKQLREYIRKAGVFVNNPTKGIGL